MRPPTQPLSPMPNDHDGSPVPTAEHDALPKPPAGVLERGLSILQCFSEDRLRMNLRELATCTGLDKATLLRLLGVLAAARMVHRYDDASYSLGPAVLHMGMLYRSSFDVGARLQPALDEVMRQTGETVAFYIRSGDERVCLYRRNTSKEVRHHVEVGTRIPLADGGSSAHVLLAFTGGETPLRADIERHGYAITRSERVPEMASVALPVFEGDGTFLGAMVVIGLASRHDAAAQRRAAAVVKEQLGVWGFGVRPGACDAVRPAPSRRTGS